MAEFIGEKENNVNIGEPVVFENKTDFTFEVSAGVVFHKSGIYEVSVLKNKTIISKVTERKKGKWMDDTISRQAAIDALDCINGVEEVLRSLPSVQPERTEERTETHACDLISRQDAIDALDVLCQEHRYKIPGKRETYSQYSEAWQDALDRAEGAIFNLPSAQPVVTDTNVGDTISRQAALEKVRAMQTYKLFVGDDMILVDKAEVQTELMMQPSVHPEPQEGEWIPVQRCEGDTQPDLECPFCKHRIGWFDMGKYCAGCGAKLKGGA